MLDKLNSVKIGPTSNRAYHYGDLCSALLDARVALIEERGVDGFSLREVARRAGVSPAAPAHHFRDARGLLTAIATEAFLSLEAAASTAEADRPAKLLALAQAYLGFALTNRGRYMLMWQLTEPELRHIPAAAT